MNNINIKVKEKEPSDETILAKKNFSAVIDQHNVIKSSYAKVASLWGATIGMTVFLAFAVTETIGSNNDTINNRPDDDWRDNSTNFFCFTYGSTTISRLSGNRKRRKYYWGDGDGNGNSTTTNGDGNA